VLTDIKPNYNLVLLPNGEKIHKMTLESNPTTPRKELGGRCYYDITGGKFDFKKYVEYVNGEILKGFQLRYVYFIDKRCKEKLTVPIIPFSKIDELGAGMYKGEKVTQSERHNKKQPE
jgi:hypothetical protein